VWHRGKVAWAKDRDTDLPEWQGPEAEVDVGSHQLSRDGLQGEGTTALAHVSGFGGRYRELQHAPARPLALNLDCLFLHTDECVWRLTLAVGANDQFRIAQQDVSGIRLGTEWGQRIKLLRYLAKAVAGPD
jgi:hypothetical protein